MCACVYIYTYMCEFIHQSTNHIQNLLSTAKVLARMVLPIRTKSPRVFRSHEKSLHQAYFIVIRASAGHFLQMVKTGQITEDRQGLQIY